MKTWEPSDIEEMSSYPIASDVSDVFIGDEKEQVLCLIKLITDWSLTQEIKEPTHGVNTLDLMFTNKSESIEEIEILENVTLSDHSFIIARILRESLEETEETKTNFCTTNVPKFDLKGASPEAWARARIDLREMYFEGRSNT